MLNAIVEERLVGLVFAAILEVDSQNVRNVDGIDIGRLTMRLVLPGDVGTQSLFRFRSCCLLACSCSQNTVASTEAVGTSASSAASDHRGSIAIPCHARHQDILFIFPFSSGILGQDMLR